MSCVSSVQHRQLTLIARAKSGHTETERSAVLHDGVVNLGETLTELLLRALLPSRIDEAEGEECTALGELGRRVPSREVRLDDAPAVDVRAAVDETKGGSGRELGPVGRAAKPVEVLAQEAVRGGAAVGKRVGEGDGRVVDRVAVLEGLLGHLEDAHVGLVVLLQKVEV